MLLSYVSPCLNVAYITFMVLCVCTLVIFTSWSLLVFELHLGGRAILTHFLISYIHNIL